MEPSDDLQVRALFAPAEASAETPRIRIGLALGQRQEAVQLLPSLRPDALERSRRAGALTHGSRASPAPALFLRTESNSCRSSSGAVAVSASASDSSPGCAGAREAVDAESRNPSSGDRGPGALPKDSEQPQRSRLSFSASMERDRPWRRRRDRLGRASAPMITVRSATLRAPSSWDFRDAPARPPTSRSCRSRDRPGPRRLGSSTTGAARERSRQLSRWRARGLPLSLLAHRRSSAASSVAFTCPQRSRRLRSGADSAARNAMPSRAARAATRSAPVG
jgi:hypothetical protein